MARVLTALILDRRSLNMPALQVEWDDGGEVGNVSIYDDAARAIVDGATGAIDFEKLSSFLDSLASAVAEAGSVTARMNAANAADVRVRAAAAQLLEIQGATDAAKTAQSLQSQLQTANEAQQSVLNLLR